MHIAVIITRANLDNSEVKIVTDSSDLLAYWDLHVNKLAMPISCVKQSH